MFCVLCVDGFIHVRLEEDGLRHKAEVVTEVRAPHVALNV